MDGFDGAPLVAGAALGYRWWTLRSPQLALDPGLTAVDWVPGLLQGVKGAWEPGVNLAQCQAAYTRTGRHEFRDIPHDACGCGFWAYWEIQPHDMGRSGTLPVVGVVKATGQVTLGPRGFRAQKAEIIALHLPFRIEPELPPQRLARIPDYVQRALPGSSQVVTHRRFTGQVINYGTSYVPAPFRDPPPPEPPSEKDIQAARDKAEAWMAVIEDRLAVMYPGAEVCATLDLMKAKYPVKSEYAPPEEEQVHRVSCPYCGNQVETGKVQRHLAEKHYL